MYVNITDCHPQQFIYSKLQHDHDPCINDDGIHGVGGSSAMANHDPLHEYDGKEKEGDARKYCSSRNRSK